MLRIIIIRIYVYLLGPELSAIVEIALRGFGGTAGEILWGNAGKFWIVGLGGTGGGIGFPEGLKDIIEIDMSCLEKDKKKKNFFSSKKNIFLFLKKIKYTLEFDSYDWLLPMQQLRRWKIQMED